MSRGDGLNEGGEASNIITRKAVKIIEDCVRDLDGYEDLNGFKKLLYHELHTAFAGLAEDNLEVSPIEAWKIYNRTRDKWLASLLPENREYFLELFDKIAQGVGIGTAVFYGKSDNDNWRDRAITVKENKERLVRYSREDLIKPAVNPLDYDMDGTDFDCAVEMNLNTTTNTTRKYFAINFFDDIYTKFEEYFLMELGLDEALLPNFKDIVFDELIEWDFLQDPKALAGSIDRALVRFYNNEAILAEKIHLLQQIYSRDTGKDSPTKFMPVETFHISALIKDLLNSIED